MKMYTESVHYVIKKRRALGVLAVMLAIVRWRRQRRHYSLRMSRRKYGPLVDRDLERQKKLNDLYNSTDKNCISQLRTTGPLRSGFDDVNKQVMLSKSTLDGLSANDRGILSKPIQFYDKLKDYLVARRQMALLCKTLSLQLKLTMMIRYSMRPSGIAP
ncbi:hypothetical protein VPH35_064432 [Triticum aestivum]|uniref:uncharacterized protein n=1 Tax=Triticum aestivum TaxID=4565 RepID=UPI001D001B3C|nr:uncharacterized protein LOC123084860 [Triticum aestivum]